MKELSIKALIISITVGLTGILSTYYSSVKVSNKLTSQYYVELEQSAKQVSIRFQDAVDQSVNDLQALQAFYSANKQRSSSIEFNRYMDILNIESRHHIQALSWVPLIKHDMRNDFEIQIKKQYPNFEITERDNDGKLIVSQIKDYYTPVTYIEPYQKNKAAQGFDLNSSDTRRASLNHAKATGKMTATAKIRLVQEKEDSYGFLIIAPVHKEVTSGENDSLLIKELIGYVTGVFRINNLMENARQQADHEEFVLSLVDVDEKTGGRLYGTQHDTVAFNFNITIPDRQWNLEISLNESLLKDVQSPPIVYWILLSGSLISLLLAISVYGLQIAVSRAKHITVLSDQLKNQNIQLEQIVEERTQSLADTNEQLNSHVDELERQGIELSHLMEQSQKEKVKAQERATALARSNKDLDDFAYVASHDLKAPLRGIDQLASWIAEDIQEGTFEEVPENLQLMRSRVQRLEFLLNDLLAYSRANKQEGTITTVHCNALIEETFTLLCPPPQFKLTIDDNLPEFSTVSPPFEQVIRNLMSNAIKHHGQEDGHLKVRYEEQESFFKFYFEDDGVGIDENYYDDIFQMFKTLKPRDETEGSGMGLALLKKIIEYYGGEINVSSTVNVGSIFYFTWPKEITDTTLNNMKG